jgi:hypothetical protein
LALVLEGSNTLRLILHFIWCEFGVPYFSPVGTSPIWVLEFHWETWRRSMMDTSLWREWTNEHVQTIKHKQFWYPNSLFLMSPSHFPYEFLGRRKGPSLLLHEVDIHIHPSILLHDGKRRCQKLMWLYCWHHLLRREKLLYFENLAPSLVVIGLLNWWVFRVFLSW